MNLIEIQAVRKKFQTDFWKKPVEVLKGIDLEISPGKTIGFLGANGAGKTTLIKILMGFIPATQGRVHFSRELGKNSLDALKSIGFLPERPYFYPHLTGREFCEYMAKLQRVSKKNYSTRLEQWSHIFKIDHALNRSIRGYSKGMLQRLGFCAALLHDPKLIILDEPLSGLDPIGRKELKEVISKLKLEGKSIFFSSHIISDVEEVCDEVIFLKEGIIQFQGNINELIQQKSSLQYIVRYKGSRLEDSHQEYLPGEFSCSIEEGKKQELLKKIIENGSDLVYVEKEKKSLEEIFYHEARR